MLRVLNQIFLRRTISALSVSLARELYVPGLRVDDRFTELNEDILNESPCEDEPGNANGDRSQGGCRPGPLAKDASQCETEETGCHRLLIAAQGVDDVHSAGAPGRQHAGGQRRREG